MTAGALKTANALIFLNNNSPMEKKSIAVCIEHGEMEGTD